MKTKTITFYNQKGGAGKTTALVLIALGLAEKGKTVAILDMDNLKIAKTFVDDANNPKIQHYKKGGKYDFALVDTGGGVDPSEVKEIEDFSDLILIPMGLTAPEIKGTSKAIRDLSNLKKTKLLLNRVSTRTQAYAQKKNVLSALPVDALNAHLTLRVCYQYAFGDGWTALDKKAREEVLNLIKEIL
jgi:chromosome partitioning protein